MSDEASSTTTWETIVQQYRERAARDDARIDELTQRANHWHDTADVLMRQRNLAEEERDGWKERAMQSEQQRQSLRDQLILAEGQRDQAIGGREYWKDEWALVAGKLAAVRAECEALRTVDDAMVGRFLRAYAECESERPQTFTHRMGVRAALDAALAVQP